MTSGLPPVVAIKNEVDIRSDGHTARRMIDSDETFAD